MRPIPHPWRTLSQLDDVVVCWRSSLPGTKHAATDGQNIIWMAKNLLQVERRCALQHELVHIELGHTCHQDNRIESLVRRITAQRLIPSQMLFGAWKAALSVEEWADALWVTPPVLEDRLDGLTADEEHTAQQLIEDARERGAD